MELPWLPAPACVVADCHSHATALLRAKGWGVKQVFRVVSAGDSPSGFEEIDFLGGDGEPRTATIRPDVEAKTFTLDVRKWERRGPAV